jgi:hypothetical protein
MTTKFPGAYSYSAVHDFWPVVDLVEQKKGPTAPVKVVREGVGEEVFICLDVSVTRSTIPTEAKRRNRTNTTLSLH